MDENSSPAAFGLTKPAYATNEVLQVLPFGRTTLNKAVRDGKLKAVKIGKKTVYFAVDIAAYLANLRAA
jgi:hypothetical protein